MNINYVLTAFSPAMFGQRATTHISIISLEEAKSLVNENTRLMATRITHEKLGRGVFPNLSPEPTRYADLRPGVNAIHLHYRGPPLDQSGELPPGSVVTPYLIEVQEFQET